MRDETEWVETVQLGWNQLTGASADRLVNAVDQCLTQRPNTDSSQPYGNGNASMAILSQMVATKH